MHILQALMHDAFLHIGHYRFGMNEAAEKPKAYVRYVLEKTGKSPSALAKDARVSQTTITRPLNDPDHQFVFSNSTLEKIGRATGITYEQFLLHGSTAEHHEIQRVNVARASAPVVATVEAGAWREVDPFDQSEREWIAVEPDSKFPHATQEVYRVSGDSMNEADPHPIKPGSQVVAVRYEDIMRQVPLRDGLIVVVQRTRGDGQEREISIKEVAWFDDRIEFRPRSSNPKHRPIVIQHNDWEDNGVTVEVLALVRSVINEMPV